MFMKNDEVNYSMDYIKCYERGAFIGDSFIRAFHSTWSIINALQKLILVISILAFKS